MRRAPRVLTCVDLSDTISIDQSGKRLLRAMYGEEVRFIAKAPYVKRLIRQLSRNGTKQAPCLSPDETAEAQ